MSDKRKILLVVNNLQTGGVYSSLVNLVSEIHNTYDVTVLSFALKDDSHKAFPDDVELIGLNSPYKYFGFSQGDLKQQPFLYFKRAFWAVLIRIFGRSKLMPVINIFQKKLSGFDCAISFLHECPQKNIYGGCNEFVLKKVDAKKKITWLHCDFGLCGANNSFSKKIYSEFDKIVACSDGTKEAFVKCLPEFADKCASLRNCNDYKKIIELSKCDVEYDKSYFNIVTVARLAEEKGIDRALKAVKHCIENGHKIKYHIIGSGDQEENLKNLVAELGIEKNVVFYGNQKNPYPYMVNADLFLLSSYHEAAPMVFDEAACIGIPVLATKTTSTDEMIIKSESGFVCENSETGITEGLSNILNSPDLLIKIRENLQSREFDNADIVEKFNEIVF